MSHFHRRHLCHTPYCFRCIDRAMIRHPLCSRSTPRHEDNAISTTTWRVANMLDRFKVPLEDQVHVSEAALRQTVAAIFEKCNLTPEDAAIGADVLVTTDLRGVESHGVSNMLRSYVQSYQKGDYNPRPNWRIVRESPSTATIDGDGGLGVILGPKAMRLAIDKARAVGVALS